MTDEYPHEEEEKSKPHLKFEDGKLWRRDKNDEWAEVTPKETGDPELDSLWALPAREVDRIANDESDLLHEKAKQVQYEAAEPFRQMAESIRYPFDMDFAKNLFYFPQVRFDWWTDNLAANWGGLLGPRKGIGSDADKELPVESDTPGHPDESIVAEEVDAGDPPDFVREPTVTEEEALGWAKLREQRRFNEQWEKFAREAKDSGSRANEIAEGANRLAKDSNVLSSEANSHAARANVTAQDSHRLSKCAFFVSVVAALAALGSWIWG